MLCFGNNTITTSIHISSLDLLAYTCTYVRLDVVVQSRTDLITHMNFQNKVNGAYTSFHL